MIAELIGLALVVLLVVEGIRRFRRSQSQERSARPPLPPGPKPLPFLGNLLDLDKDAPHLTYMAWSKTYGDIIYLRVLGQDMIVLNSEQVASELLEKRSENYSDRPVFSAIDLFGWESTTTVLRYGPTFRLHRRLLHQSFHANAAWAHRNRQLQKAYEMLTRLLDDPEHYVDHFTTFVEAVVMEVTYGYDLKGGQAFVAMMHRAADIFVSVASTPELSALCTMFPFVKALPSWFPGMGFKSVGAECQRLVSEGVNAPYEWVKRRVDEGSAAPSMVADAIVEHGLDDSPDKQELVQAIKDSAGALYAAATETTNATLVIFVYLMLNHPDIQRRAQAEIDRVVGRKRLPDFDDRASLPYVEALLRETMRWHPVAPTGIPHAPTEDDVYQGYHIPQGAMILPNIWSMSRNEDKYPDPEVFMPERFLREDGTPNDDKLPWIFGFGRRICPGRNIAEISLWSAVACILAVFRIEKTEGSDNVKWTTGLVSHPLPFPCKLVPRDEGMDGQKLAALIGASRIDLRNLFVT